MRFQSGLVVFGLSQFTLSLESVTILADTNRDGFVDLTGDSDWAGKQNWTETRGAIFMANIGDTDGRCSSNITDKTPNEDLEKCHDASDNILRIPKFLAPMRTLPIAGLGERAIGLLSVSNDQASQNVRLFYKAGGEWQYVNKDYRFSAQVLERGLELGIDARDVRRPRGWDGRALVRFIVIDGNETVEDVVALRVAPVLTHHHLQKAEQLVVVNTKGLPVQEAFVADLKQNSQQAGLIKPVIELPNTDIWTQDLFEAGYTSMPGPDGPLVLRVLIRSSQKTRDAGRMVFTHLRSSNVGAVQYLADGGSQDSTGNLETIPPYCHDGICYPAGRAFMGIQDATPPFMLDFLDAQEAQHPIPLDTSWLWVGHVDEFIQFMPADTPRGWAIIADDPLAGLDLLKGLQQAGHGTKRWLSRSSFKKDPSLPKLPQGTIDELIATPNITEINIKCASYIQANLDIIKRETGVTDSDILRLPGLYYTAPGANKEGPLPVSNSTVASSARISQRDSDTGIASSVKVLNIVEASKPKGGSSMSPRSDSNNKFVTVSGFYPATVNGVLLNSTSYLAPNPWGPVIDGMDVIAQRVSATYQRLNITVQFMDDYYSHHVLDGQVHCGSNTLRNANQPWW